MRSIEAADRMLFNGVLRHHRPARFPDHDLRQSPANLRDVAVDRAGLFRADFGLINVLVGPDVLAIAPRLARGELVLFMLASGLLIRPHMWGSRLTVCCSRPDRSANASGLARASTVLIGVGTGLIVYLGLRQTALPDPEWMLLQSGCLRTMIALRLRELCSPALSLASFPTGLARLHRDADRAAARHRCNSAPSQVQTARR
jgi:hypothetical protein